MPLAPPVQVQREVTSQQENSMSVEPASEAESELDLDDLSEKVWRRLENRIRVERERQFGLP
jgi:hypothetical protein